MVGGLEMHGPHIKLQHNNQFVEFSNEKKLQNKKNFVFLTSEDLLSCILKTQMTDVTQDLDKKGVKKIKEHEEDGKKSLNCNHLVLCPLKWLNLNPKTLA